MLRTVESHKYQKSISYYTEDIELCESGEYACTGYADDDSGAYDITFNKRGENYYINDITEKE